MTNQRAISHLKDISMWGIIQADEYNALKMAIKALESISKYKDAYGKGWEDGSQATYEHIKMCEEEQEQEPQPGHWEWVTEDKYRCSSCNCETRVDECLNKPMYEFCPFCGKKMAESEGKE